MIEHEQLQEQIPAFLTARLDAKESAQVQEHLNGCEDCTVSRDLGEPDRIRYGEIWLSEKAFGAHVRSPEFRYVLTAMDMCCERPRVVCGGMSGRSGLEYLRDLREDFDPVLDPEI